MLNVRDKIITKALINSLTNKKYSLSYFDDIEPSNFKQIDNLFEIISKAMSLSITKKEESNHFFSLTSIYNDIKPINNKRFVHDNEQHLIYPTIKENKMKTFDIEKMIESKIFNNKNLSVNYILKTLDENFSNIQSISSYNNKVNVSFYDEIMMKTALIINSLDYLEEKKIDLNNDIINDKAILLASFDFSGIQKFVFDIPTEGALRNMRVRSFYLEILAKTFSQEILAKLGLCQANIVYIGGGHGYLLLPNTTKAKQIFNNVVETYNKHLLRTYKYSLYLSKNIVETSISEILNLNKTYNNSFNNVMGKVFAGISDDKKHKYNKEILTTLNDNKTFDNVRECKSCGESSLLINNNICENCKMFLNFSKIIINNTSNIFVLLKDKIQSNNDYLIIPYDNDIAFLYGLSDKEYINLKEKNTYIIEVFEKNKNSKVPSASNIYIADNAVRDVKGNQLSIEDIVKTKVTGIKRIAMLKLDIDSLGMVFKEGFTNNEYNIFKMKSLSDSLSLFFKNHINKLSVDFDITIIFSGGDDTFLLGNLDSILNFTKKMYSDFNKYVIGKLTFSVSIGIFPTKYPIYKVVDYMDSLLLDAKSSEGKNAITLFESKYTIKLKEFDVLIGDKDTTSDLFLINSVLEKRLISDTVLYSKIYKSLKDLKKEDKSITHRFAYMLGRIRKELDKEILRDNTGLFDKLTNKLISCTNYNNKEERKILLIAIQIYIYTNRIREEV